MYKINPLVHLLLIIFIGSSIILSGVHISADHTISNNISEQIVDDGWMDYPPYPNYAPSGMPDFACCQDSCWFEEYNGQYTMGHDSICFANIFWYLDSMFSNQNGNPGDGLDNFTLVIDFNAPGIPNPGPNTDDHNFNNVNDLGTPWEPFNPNFKGELVETIAQYIGANKTNIIGGVNSYLKDVNLSRYFKVERISKYHDGVYPTFEDIAYYFYRKAGVMLVISWIDENNKPVSHHSVTLSGINSIEKGIILSDASADNGHPLTNLYSHNDASYVSHDKYLLNLSSYNDNVLKIVDFWIPDAYDSYVKESIIVSLWAIIPNLHAPDKPCIIGPSSGRTNINQTYCINCIDMDGDNIQYYIEWGDNSTANWSEPFNSNETVNFSHIWVKQGNYSIKVKARDELGRQSYWETFEVSMSKSKSHLSFLEEHFPFLFNLLFRLSTSILG
jgi:PKD domain